MASGHWLEKSTSFKFVRIFLFLTLESAATLTTKFLKQLFVHGLIIYSAESFFGRNQEKNQRTTSHIAEEFLGMEYSSLNKHELLPIIYSLEFVVIWLICCYLIRYLYFRFVNAFSPLFVMYFIYGYQFVLIPQAHENHVIVKNNIYFKWFSLFNNKKPKNSFNLFYIWQ